MRTAGESLEIAIRVLCERSGTELAEGARGVRETLEANGYVIVPRDATWEIAAAFWGQDNGWDIYRDMIEAALLVRQHVPSDGGERIP